MDLRVGMTLNGAAAARGGSRRAIGERQT